MKKDKSSILEVLSSDTEFLASNNLMDYSLLLVIEDLHAENRNRFSKKAFLNSMIKSVDNIPISSRSTSGRPKQMSVDSMEFMGHLFQINSEVEKKGLHELDENFLFIDAKR